jgi:hypothetical protein
VKGLIDRVIKEAEEIMANMTGCSTFKPLRKPTAAPTQ